MDDSLYDEFGNYIGPELSGSEVGVASEDPAPCWGLQLPRCSSHSILAPGRDLSPPLCALDVHCGRSAVSSVLSSSSRRGATHQSSSGCTSCCISTQ
jgi:hypothetical protein